VPEDTVLGQPAKGIFQVFKGIIRGFDRSIFNLSALHTGDVIVIPGVAVKPHLGQPRFQPVDNSARGKNVKIAVNRTHADSWEFFSDPLINLIRRGMSLILINLFEDHLALMGHSVFLIRVQRSLHKN
jgi:hypothetical protein